jgi:Lar family restriction alleviation protein
MPKIEYKLKPCPFCGEDEHKKYPPYYNIELSNYDDRHLIACPFCGAQVRAESEIEAVNAWNRRNGQYD